MSEICRACRGKGRVSAFVDYADRGELRDDLPCSICRGAGVLTPDQAERVLAGEQMRKARVAAGISIREAAALHGMSPAAYSALERGVKDV